MPERNAPSVTTLRVLRRAGRFDPGVFLLSFGHLVTDINQGALPALRPLLLTEYHLSFIVAASLVLAPSGRRFTAARTISLHHVEANG